MVDPSLLEHGNILVDHSLRRTPLRLGVWRVRNAPQSLLSVRGRQQEREDEEVDEFEGQHRDFSFGAPRQLGLR